MHAMMRAYGDMRHAAWVPSAVAAMAREVRDHAYKGREISRLVDAGAALLNIA
jgi:hypothetical protein